MIKMNFQHFLQKLHLLIARKCQIYGRCILSDGDSTFAAMFSGLNGRKAEISIKCNSPDDLNTLSDVPIYLHFNQPQEGALFVVFGKSYEVDADRCRLALQRLAVMPVRQKVYLMAETADVAAAVRPLTGLPILVQGDIDKSSPNVPAPAINCTKFGKVACIVTAFWGRTGSTAIFDAQTEYLLEKGYFVCRIFVEHWPKPLLASRFISENFEYVKPHLHLIATRTDAGDRIHGRSSIGRTVNALANTEFHDPKTMEWIAGLTDIVITNHLAQIGFAKKHFRAPIVLESHDIMSDLYDSHGVPDFAAHGPDERDDRLMDENEALKLADHCICLSSTDRDFMLPHVKSISVIRPYARPPSASGLSWSEILASHKLPSAVQKLDGFDLLLWGDWHRGNVRSCASFFENVYPLLQPYHLEIAIAGRLGSAIPKSITRLTGVHTLGRVDNLYDFMMRSKVSVIYDVTGSGISIKAMETLAAGKAFASTQAGMRHIDTGTTNYLPSTSPRKLAEDIVKLCQSSSARRARERVADELYKCNFSKEQYDNAWDDIIEVILPRLTKEVS